MANKYILTQKQRDFLYRERDKNSELYNRMPYFITEILRLGKYNENQKRYLKSLIRHYYKKL